MNKITRKDFLRLSAAATAAIAVPGCAADDKPTPAAAARSGSANATLIRGADLLTMDPTLGEMTDTDVLIENGRIAAIGGNLTAPAGAEIVEAAGMILMPGMIDGHRHVWEFFDLGRKVKSHPRDYATTYQHWKMRTIVSMTPEDHYLAELIGGLHAIESGVTSVLDYAHGQTTEENAVAAARGIKDSGVAGWFAFQLGVSSAYKPGDTVSLEKASGQRVATTTETHWKTAARIHQEVFSDSSAPMQFALAPSAGQGKPIPVIKEEWARVRGTGVKMLALHVHKPATPAPAGHMGHRDNGILDLHEAGLLGPDFHISHANRLTAEELKILRETGGMVCATTMGEFPYMMEGHRGPPVHGRARAAGVPCGVGIDAILALPGEYFEHVRAALWSHYLEEESRQLVDAYQSADVLDFVTGMGARAIRLGDVAGTITKGKRADLVLLSTKRIGFGMAGTLADRVVTFGTTPDVDSVWIAGKARKRNGVLLGVDWAKLKTQLVEAQERVGRQAATVTFT
jgi:cytosine/adenosine deaminase-related metal-dependent hydrolase